MGKKREKETVELFCIGNNSVGVTGSCIYGVFKDEEFLIELGGVQDGTSLSNYNKNKELLDKIDFKRIKYIFILHFHQDHSQLTLAANSRGFDGKVITNHKTARILQPLWEDASHIMDVDIKFLRSAKGIKAEHLYKVDDVAKTLDYVYEYEENVIHKLSESISFRLLRNNHVLGSTSLELFFKDSNSKVHKLYYSSDLGNTSVGKYFVFDEIDKCVSTNVAILENTYNSKDREPITKKTRKEDLIKLENAILDTIVEKKGRLICPCFAADRSQNLLVHIKNIIDKHDSLKDTTVYLDGKLTSKIMKLYGELLEGEQKELFDSIINWKNLKIVSDYMTGTRMILADNNPYICISSSGMADKGHVLEHIKANIKDKKNTILFSGFTSPTSLASRIKEKINNPNKSNILIEKTNYPFRCDVVELTSMSSHIQRKELIEMMKQIRADKIVLVHGDIKDSKTLAQEAMDEIMRVNKTTRVLSAEKNMHIEF